MPNDGGDTDDDALSEHITREETDTGTVAYTIQDDDDTDAPAPPPAEIAVMEADEDVPDRLFEVTSKIVSGEVTTRDEVEALVGASELAEIEAYLAHEDGLDGLLDDAADDRC